jgi:PKD repeat protein
MLSILLLLSLLPVSIHMKAATRLNKHKFHIILFVYLLSQAAYSQCPVAEFFLSETACTDKALAIVNTSTGAASYYWDFCDGSLANLPERKMLTVLPGANPNALTVVTEGGQYLAFVTNAGNGHLLRIELDENLDNAKNTIDLGTFSGALVTPRGISKFEDQNDRFLFVTCNNTESSVSLVRLSFGDSYFNAPTVSVINLPGLTDARQIEIVKDNGNYYALFAQGANVNPGVTVLDFGNALTNTPAQVDRVVPGGAFLTGIDIIKECNSWFVFVEGYSSGIHRLDFGTHLMNLPSVVNVLPALPIGSPLNIDIVKSKGLYYAFVPTDGSSDELIRLELGATLTNTTPTVSSAGGAGLLDLPIGSALITLKTQHYWLGVNFLDNKLMKFTFPKSCDIDDNFEDQITPSVTYETTGTYDVTLIAVDNDGNSNSKTLVVTVEGTPDVSFHSEFMCAQSPINFFAENQTANISLYSWNFDDGNLSSMQNPNHSFLASGEYEVSLQVTATNGCRNQSIKTVKVYDKPNAQFALPADVLCTNGEVTFENQTEDTFEGNLSYLWFVAADAAGTNRDLTYVFTNNTSFEVKMIASIPGCSDERVIVTPTIQQGPQLNFSASGLCEADRAQFTSEIAEEIVSYEWDFDDGTPKGFDENPTHIYTSPGTYSVVLRALSNSGCNNSRTKTITIYSKPSPDFEVTAPPFSCNGSATPFDNLTPVPADSELNDFQWSFGDAAGSTSTLQDPSFIYQLAGDYSVTLTVGTDQGCYNSIQKPITIAQSPVVDLSNTPTCIGVPATFAASGNNIQSYFWEIGTSYYTVPNPSHTFSNAGQRNIKLTVEGNNDCVSVFEKLINVPVKSIPDFSVTKNCAGVDAVFTDVTAGPDVVAQRVWDFNGAGTSDQASPQFTFNTIGNKSVKLDVTTQAGCHYSVTKNIVIVNKPVAAFSAEYETAVPPIDIHFTNQSSFADSYLWTFETTTGQETSTVTSPAFTFTDLGEFEVGLTARNVQGCEDFTSKVITLVAPLPDVDLKLISVSENPDGTLKVIITIHNKGNTILKNLPVSVDISGTISLVETVEGPIQPNSMYNLVLSYGINPTNNVDYLCASTELVGDLVPEGNRICKDFEDAVVIVPAYPNPATDILGIEWVAAGGDVVEVTLVDSFGKKIRQQQSISVEGLNRLNWNVSDLNDGIFVLIIKASSNTGLKAQKTQRIVISNQN